MIDKRTIFEMHRLKNLGFSVREMATTLNLDRSTVAKYINNPVIVRKPNTPKSSKLDPHRDMIKELLDQYPKIKAPVVLRQIKEKGFDGEITIVRDYLRNLRRYAVGKQAFIRFESDPGEQMQIDWGHFGSLVYDGSRRKLYALAVIESHSRVLYVAFTHSQKQEVLHQSLMEAFRYFGGSPKEIVVDNMLTAVTERVGAMIRFNEAFLDFLRHFNITPVACNIRAPYEKGKIENSIKYLRNNFWPVRTFTDLEDVQTQVLTWLATTANKRVHQTTGEKPVERLVKDALTPIPKVLPDFRETETLKIYKDFGIRFDANVYTVPPRMVGKTVTVKADRRTLSIYYKEKQVAAHGRSWKKKQRIELSSHKEQVHKLRKKVMMDKQIRVFMSLGQDAVDYLEKLADASQPIKKTVNQLLILNDEYGNSALMCAIRKALKHKLYGLSYVHNILNQEMSPVTNHPPVSLKNKDLNNIRLTSPNLAEYDAIVLKRRRKNNGRCD